MVSEEEIIIAFLFKREGKTEISTSDFFLSLSMTLNWFSPKQAKDFVERAITKKLLVAREGILSPAFEIDSITVPVGFRPSMPSLQIEEKEVEVHKKEGEVTLQSMVHKIAKESAIGEGDITRRVQKIVEKKGISSEVAALLLGKELGVPLTEFFDAVGQGIFKQNKE
ncbi:MAG: DUF2240 family protein [Candidatus Thermoplasmatota archaeon]|nr:DUF2240 family protein [Candidatus Thermoplasmatota archaeon]